MVFMVFMHYLECNGDRVCRAKYMPWWTLILGLYHVPTFVPLRVPLPFYFGTVHLRRQGVPTVIP